MNVGLIVLAGGHSSRMGSDKARMEWRGKTCLEDVLAKASVMGFAEIIVVANSGDDFYQQLPVRVVRDVFPQQGPLAGIHAGLGESSCHYNFIISCDMPLFDFSIVNVLLTQADDTYDVVLPCSEGRQQPLAAIYTKTCRPVIEEMLQAGDRRLRHLFDRVPTRFVEFRAEKGAFFNMNTPADYILARARAINAERRIPIVSIAAGKSGSGKTTLICKLLPELKKRGIKTAVLKSDSHGFSFDHEGKDSWQFSVAGAEAVAVVSPQGYAILQKTAVKESLLAVAEKITGVDLILIESRCHGVFPVLEVERTGYSGALITPESDLAAVITDHEVMEAENGIVRLPLNDPEQVTAYICSLW